MPTTLLGEHSRAAIPEIDSALYGCCPGYQSALWADCRIGVLEELGCGQTQMTRVTMGCVGHSPTGTDDSSLQELNLVVTTHYPPTHPPSVLSLRVGCRPA